MDGTGGQGNAPEPRIPREKRPETGTYGVNHSGNAISWVTSYTPFPLLPASSPRIASAAEARGTLVCVRAWRSFTVTRP